MNDPHAGTEPVADVPDPVGTRRKPALSGEAPFAGAPTAGAPTAAAPFAGAPFTETPFTTAPPAEVLCAEAPVAEGPSRLRVALSERPERVLVEIDGVLDYETEGRLRGALDGVAAKPGRRFLLDLSRVGYLDSGGIGALLAIRRGVLSRGGELAVTEVSPMVARLLRMTGLDEVLLPGTGC
ncbi:STAS domain-containing protein [Streptomyces sp. NPDC047046]|uniref:STAS domain-containing protein n=1 Tax=Streptomyces sp. NPDC047046 TaxID=3155378 RepID=UPI003409CEB1